MLNYNCLFIQQYRSDFDNKYITILKYLKKNNHLFFSNEGQLVNSIRIANHDVDLIGYMYSFVGVLTEIGVIERLNGYKINKIIEDIDITDVVHMVQNNCTVNNYMRKKKIYKLKS
jgi:hypothetical protein